jgi:ribosomal protein L34E
MLTWSSYTLSGSPQQCAFCRRPFPSVEDRREAFHSRAAGGYFCAAECARRLIEATAEHPERRAA